MKKIILLSAFLCISVNYLFSQTNTFPTSGSVGIGTTAPNAKAQLEVNNGNIGKVKIGDVVYIGSTERVYSGNAVFGRNIYTGDADNVRALYTHFIGSQYILMGNTGISFNVTTGNVTSGDIVNNQVAMFTPQGFSVGGNIGIGTATPAGPLDIVKNPAVADNEIYFTGQSGANQNSNSLRLNFVGLNQKAGFGIQALNTGGYGTKDLVFYAHDANIQPNYTGYDEVVRFKSNGNVGIGTTTPAAKLDVNGTTYSRKLFVGTPDANTVTNMGTNLLAVNGTAVFVKAKVALYGTAWPDYVFAPTYKLPRLDSLEQFIKLNGHLPEVPKAEEVEKNGIDLGSNQALLLKKIEELTLIIIEQNKRIEKLEKEVR